MRRWSTDWFSPHAGQWRSRRMSTGTPSRAGGPAVLVFLAAVILFILFAPVWERTATSWAEPAGNVKLAEVWTRIVGELNLNPAQTQLTSFQGSWNPDGSLASLQFTAETLDGLQIIVDAERPVRSDTVSLLAGKVHQATDPLLLGPHQSPDLPSADQVFRSLDGAGITGLAAAAKTTWGENEVLELDFDPFAGGSLDSSTPAFDLTGGVVSAHDATTAGPSSVSPPAMGFALWKVETVGRKGRYNVGFFFVR